MSKKDIVYSTEANLNSGRADSINCLKFINAIPPEYSISRSFHAHNGTDSLLTKIRAQLSRVIGLLRESLKGKRIFIIRGTGVNFIPILLKPIFKHKIIAYMACTPIYDIERRAKEKDTKFQTKDSLNIFVKIFRDSLLYLQNIIIQNWILKHCDHFIVENKKAKGILKIYGVDPSNISVIPYYINEYFLDITNPPYDKSKNEVFKLAYTGQFREYDDVNLMIDIVKQLNLDNFNSKLYLIGDGDTRKDREKYAKDINAIQYVEFLGRKPHNEIPQILNDMHCLLLPMVQNLCPSTIAIKILEGAVGGKIILSNKSANNKSLFNPYYELIVDNPTKEIFIEKIKEIIKNYEKYVNHAEEIKNKHRKYRSRSIFRKKLEKILSNFL